MSLRAPHRHTAASDGSSTVGARAVNGHPQAVPGSSNPGGSSPAAPGPQAPALRQRPGGPGVLIPHTCATLSPPHPAAQAYLSPPQGSNIGWSLGGGSMESGWVPLCCPFPCGAWPSSAAMRCEAPRQFGGIAAGEVLEKGMGQSLSKGKVVRYEKMEKDVGEL